MSTTVRPQLVARFLEDQSGKPAYIESDGKRHYRIVLEIQNAPRDAYAATFELDPSYYDPARTLGRDSDGMFRLETTSYGDYDVHVKLRTKEGEVPLPDVPLSSALASTQESFVTDPEKRSAIDYIARN
jgi:hypothetical protein